MMRKFLTLMILGVAGVLLAAIPSLAVDWNVPGDFETAQQATCSDEVLNGDRIVLWSEQDEQAQVAKVVEIKSLLPETNATTEGFWVLFNKEGIAVDARDLQGQPVQHGAVANQTMLGGQVRSSTVRKRFDVQGDTWCCWRLVAGILQCDVRFCRRR